MNSTPTQSTPGADQFAGSEDFAAAALRVYAALIDLDPQAPLARSIPELASAEAVDATTLRCVVRPGFSFLRGTIRLTILIAEQNPQERNVAMRVTGSGIGMSLKIECRVTVVETDAGSRIDWQAQVLERKGLIAAVSPSLIRGAAEKVIRDGWDAMRAQPHDFVLLMNAWISNLPNNGFRFVCRASDGRPDSLAMQSSIAAC